MGQAKRRGDFEKRKSESLFYESEKKRYDAWLYENRPVVVSLNTHGGHSRRKTSSLERALLLCSLSGIGAFIVDKNGERIG